MRRRLLLTLLPVLLALLLCRASQAFPRRGDWQTLRTAHFAIHFHGGEYLFAARAARILEQGYDRLVPWLRWYPDETVHVVLSDETDSANGFARIVPYDLIAAYLAPPLADSNLGHASDWLEVLLDHELTHILHLEQTRGLPAAINAVFGKSVAPNAAEPVWVVEGIAVLSESALTDGGRLRSNLFEMMVRSAALADRIPPLDRLDGTATRWPGGTSPYLFGSHLMLYLADRHGMEAVGEISALYSGKLIPFSLNLTLEEATGTRWIELYAEWRARQRSAADALAAEVAAAGPRAGVRLTHTGFRTAQPRHAPDGQGLIYYHADIHGEPELRRLDAEDRPAGTLTEVLGRGGAAFTPDGRGVILAERDRVASEFSYDDLVYLDRATGARRRLTRGLRISQPDVSPDGRQVAATVLAPGERRLALLDLESGHLAFPVDGLALQSADGPRWSPDGRRLLFSGWRDTGDRDIFLLDLERHETRALTADRAQDLDPCWTPDGRAAIFASDRSGVYELYRHDLDSGALTRLTRVTGGAFAPDVAPDGESLVYVGYGAEGYDLYRLPLDGSDAGAAPVYVATYPETDLAREGDAPAVSDPEPYSPWPSILPRAWSPVLANDGQHQTVGLLVAGQDSLAHHLWSVNLTYTFGGNGLAYDVAYVYAGWYPSLSLYTWRFHTPYWGLYRRDGEREKHEEDRTGGAIYLALPFAEARRYHRVLLGYRIQYLQVTDYTVAPFDPAELEPSFPESSIEAGAIAGYSYSDVRSYPAGAGPERGRSFSARVSVYRGELGSDHERVTASFRYAEYVGLPWWHHSLALKLSTGLGVANTSRRGAFALGGVPEQDLSRAVLYGERLGSNYLRGYPPGALVGDRYWLINAEYRFPIYHLERGLWTLPLYLGRIHGALFLDSGEVDRARFDFDEVRLGLGTELRLDTTLAYYLPMSWRIGFARGLSAGGETRFFLGVGGVY